MTGVRELAQKKGEDAYLVQVEGRVDHVAYGPKGLENTMKILRACGLVIGNFFIWWPAHKPEDMGIFPNEE